MVPPIKEKHNNDLEQLATSVVLINKDLHIKYINPSAEILFQTSLNKWFYAEFNGWIGGVLFEGKQTSS